MNKQSNTILLILVFSISSLASHHSRRLGDLEHCQSVSGMTINSESNTTLSQFGYDIVYQNSSPIAYIFQDQEQAQSVTVYDISNPQQLNQICQQQLSGPNGGSSVITLNGEPVWLLQVGYQQGDILSFYALQPTCPDSEPDSVYTPSPSQVIICQTAAFSVGGSVYLVCIAGQRVKPPQIPIYSQYLILDLSQGSVINPVYTANFQVDLDLPIVFQAQNQPWMYLMLNELAVISLADPENPQTTNVSQVQGIIKDTLTYKSNEYLIINHYVQNVSTYFVYDLENPLSPALYATYTASGQQTYLDYKNAFSDGEKAFLLADEDQIGKGSSLVLIDISSPNDIETTYLNGYQQFDGIYYDSFSLQNQQIYLTNVYNSSTFQISALEFTCGACNDGYQLIRGQCQAPGKEKRHGFLEGKVEDRSLF